MTDYDNLANSIRKRKGILPASQSQRATPGRRTSSFELVYEASRKDGTELLQFGVDRLPEPSGWRINIAHAPGNTEGTPLPSREVWLTPNCSETLLDLIERGVPRLLEKPARVAGSPNVREVVGAADSSVETPLHVVIQGYGVKWYIKLTGAGDDWLPFDVRDYNAFIEGLALANEKLKQLDDGLPF
ncbi:MAG: hypothetical protein WCR20_20355 [Verrucomicrobiota bacterium]